MKYAEALMIASDIVGKYVKITDSQSAYVRIMNNLTELEKDHLEKEINGMNPVNRSEGHVMLLNYLAWVKRTKPTVEEEWHEFVIEKEAEGVIGPDADGITRWPKEDPNYMTEGLASSQKLKKDIHSHVDELGRNQLIAIWQLFNNFE